MILRKGNKHRLWAAIQNSDASLGADWRICVHQTREKKRHQLRAAIQNYSRQYQRWIKELKKPICRSSHQRSSRHGVAQVTRLSSCSPSKLSPWALAWRRDEGAQILNLVKIGRGRAREEERMHLVDLLARHPTRSSQGHSGGWLSRTRVTRRGDGLNYYLIASSISYYTQYFEILNNAETRKLIFLKIKIK